MKLTLSVIPADGGAIGGHTKPSPKMLTAVRTAVLNAVRDGLLIDGFVSHTGDDIAIIMSHTRGTGDARIHKLAWDSFIAATELARGDGLYGAGQVCSSTRRREIFGGRSAVAEMEIDHDPEGPRARIILRCWRRQCGPGASISVYLGFADPMYWPGCCANMIKGFPAFGSSIWTMPRRQLSARSAEVSYQIAALLRATSARHRKLYSRTGVPKRVVSPCACTHLRQILAKTTR
jgi:fructose 1,6-bisphosphate aldolase/phosphatase